MGYTQHLTLGGGECNGGAVKKGKKPGIPQVFSQHSLCCKDFNTSLWFGHFLERVVPSVLVCMFPKNHEGREGTTGHLGGSSMDVGWNSAFHVALIDRGPRAWVSVWRRRNTWHGSIDVVETVRYPTSLTHSTWYSARSRC